jgi:hypothetical protein
MVLMEIPWSEPSEGGLRALLRRLRARSPVLLLTARRGLAEVTGPGDEHAIQVLESARALLERGWVQGAWFRVVRPSGREQRIGPMELHRLAGAEVTGACLVGALVRGTWATSGTAKADAGPAVDEVWDALLEQTDSRLPQAVGRAAPRQVRLRRVQELTRWNDAPGRTVDEVLALVDVAISRAIFRSLGVPTAAPAR